MALIETFVHSNVLGMEMPVNIILPQEKQPYRRNNKRKVLWLLHGGSGDESAWLRMTNIERYANDYDIAVITPGGLNSCFTNMEHGGKFFTYLTEELPFILRQIFPLLSPKREDNYIAGFSNGGYGCLRNGLARPDIYSAIGAFSAGDKSDVSFENDGSKKARGRIEVFGDGEIKGTNHDLKFLAMKAIETGQPLPKIYHACGSLDPWLDLNEILCSFFRKQGVYDYTYHLAEGYGHTWDFWDKEIVNFLEFLQLCRGNTSYIGL
ncbi:S-formylglutathione hydrolase FrmB [Gracilibacillus ureilyticus]|uniref:S-formylglutathione hydrolase FrmB n=1 Tax=Gracilibacillus ureilyticus TaxID=531814 RepID=A0A1H9Q2C9_9BACI|nr:alpha/beta hydrolase-fold protein [Gracilibacillus ureilyticus]SER54621.1 S-formylglutathione hydrolase FrmB [Gracilibacillus ureilyticus]